MLIAADPAFRHRERLFDQSVVSEHRNPRRIPRVSGVRPLIAGGTHSLPFGMMADAQVCWARDNAYRAVYNPDKDVPEGAATAAVPCTTAIPVIQSVIIA